MKKYLLITVLALLLSACSGWVYNVPTFPAPPPTFTPFIASPTPRFATPTITNTPIIATTVAPLPTETGTATATSFPTQPTLTATFTSTAASSIPANSIQVDVLGCNTSIDITQGMGEVTNAYVVVKNGTGKDLKDVCTTLFALDEGRVHPDKTVCVPALTNAYQVTLKLTVDSTYQQDTPIQVEVKSESSLLARIGWPSCRDIGLLAPKPASLKTPTPIP